MLLCFFCGVKLVGFRVPIVGRWLCVISEYVQCIELFSDSELGGDLLEILITVIGTRKTSVNSYRCPIVAWHLKF
jgi:hypothetical protein